MTSIGKRLACIFIIFAFVGFINAQENEDVEENGDGEEPTVSETFAIPRATALKYNSSYTSALNLAIAITMCEPPAEGEKSCNIDTNYLKENHPVFVNDGDHRFLEYPDDNGIIKLQAGQRIFVSCPSDFSGNSLNLDDRWSFMSLECVCNYAFVSDDTIYDLSTLVCEKPLAYHIRHFDPEGGVQEFVVGVSYDGNAYSFRNLLTVHWHLGFGRALWVRSDVPHDIAKAQRPMGYEQFKRDFCCDEMEQKMQEVFDNQEKSFEKNFKCVRGTKRCNYYSKLNDFHFVRGYLAPPDNFFYQSEGVVAYTYLNTVPMWKGIKRGNWALIEANVVELGKVFKKDLTVFTGTMGKFTMEDPEQGIVPHVHLESNSRQFSTLVPGHFWKIVFDPETMKGMAYVTLNNPHGHNPREGPIHKCSNPMFTIEDDKLSKNWEPKNFLKGYSYMCQIADFIDSNKEELEDFINTYDWTSPQHRMTELLYIKDDGKKLWVREDLK